MKPLEMGGSSPENESKNVKHLVIDFGVEGHTIELDLETNDEGKIILDQKKLVQIIDRVGVATTQVKEIEGIAPNVEIT